MKRASRWAVIVLALGGSCALAQVAPSAPGSPAPDAPPTPQQPIPDAPPVELTTPAPPPATTPEPVEKTPLFPSPNVANEVHVGLHAALNIGLLSVDLHVKRWYSFIAGNLGVPMVTNGELGAFAVGSGYSLPLSPPGDSMWLLDLFAVVNPGWQTRWDQFSMDSSARPFVGLGVGLGFRLLHWSGFTFGIKVPVFGAAINGGSTTSEAVSTFYLANGVGLPIVSFGYHW